jgi:hypothetical protein
MVREDGLQETLVLLQPQQTSAEQTLNIPLLNRHIVH